MNNICMRLKRRCVMTLRDFRNDLQFSLKLAVFRVIDNLSGRIGLNNISSVFHRKKEQYILDYLEDTISDVIKKYRQIDESGEKEDCSPIWVCWWTGVDTAPKIVQQCIKSIKKNSNGHPVHIVTENNVNEFIRIPDYMINKVKRKKMGLVHLADYIRVSLLEKYGGLWLDATIYCSDVIPEWYFSFPFFTCKSEYRESIYLSKYQWVTFCLGGWRRNAFYAFMKEAFEAYWKENNSAIDYLFFDDLIYLARNNIPAIKSFMDAVPINTPHRDDLQRAFNENLSAASFESVVKKDTPLYKLSWREKYKEMTDEGSQSIYGYFLNLDIQ